MTGATTGARPGLRPAASLTGQAAAAGLRVLASAAWPESAADRVPPPIAGFVVSSFSPLAAETARRCLGRRPVSGADGDPGTGPAVTAVIVVSPLGDLAGAVHVAGVTDRGGRPGPLLFFQAVPNAVAGHVAALWHLTGPVVCVGDTGAGLDVAALLLEDGDADEALLIRVDQSPTATTPDRATAILLRPGPDPVTQDGPGHRPGAVSQPSPAQPPGAAGLPGSGHRPGPEHPPGPGRQPGYEPGPERRGGGPYSAGPAQAPRSGPYDREGEQP